MLSFTNANNYITNNYIFILFIHSFISSKLFLTLVLSEWKISYSPHFTNTREFIQLETAICSPVLISLKNRNSFLARQVATQSKDYSFQLPLQLVWAIRTMGFKTSTHRKLWKPPSRDSSYVLFCTPLLHPFLLQTSVWNTDMTVLGTILNHQDVDHPGDGRLVSWNQLGSLKTSQSRPATLTLSCLPPEMYVRWGDHF